MGVGWRLLGAKRPTVRPFRGVSRASSCVAAPCSVLERDIFFDSHGTILAVNDGVE